MNKQEPMDLAAITKESFTPWIDSEFSLVTEDGEIKLKLLEVSAYPDHRPEGQQTSRKPFSLVFGCNSHALMQNTYCLQHKELAPLVVFLSPFEAYENGHKLEAVFS